MPQRLLEELEAEITEKFGSWTVERIGKGKRETWVARLDDPWRIQRAAMQEPRFIPVQAIAYNRESAIRRLHEDVTDPKSHVARQPIIAEPGAKTGAAGNARAIGDESIGG